MRRALVAMLVWVAAAATMLARPATAAQHATVVTATQVNGRWRSGANTITVRALGKNRLRVSFDLIYEYQTPGGPIGNLGTGGGIATIEGDTAIYRTDDPNDICQITFHFAKGRMIVTQVGICGFGQHVSAEGTYHKVSARTPK
jgi:hypothetical protein